LVERFGGQLAGDANLEVTGSHRWLTPAFRTSAFSAIANSAQAAQSGGGTDRPPADDALIGAGYSGARIVVPNPYVYFARRGFRIADDRAPAGIHASAVVAPARRWRQRLHRPARGDRGGRRDRRRRIIGAGCFIGREAVIGEGTQLFANVTFHARCQIGKRGIIHSGAVIGTDGFGFANEGGVYIKIPQTGRVVIGDDVDIGANTTIDRGALADTIIEDGVKLDNQIQIGHNCHIGRTRPWPAASAWRAAPSSANTAPLAAPPWCWAI
jgi:UDP-3-O-[3-hydroxymyristoyl] glucosamine N-acyltransferase